MERNLLIFEELTLLALRDDKGTVLNGTWPDIAVGGGILSELALGGHIDIKPVKRSNRVIAGENATDHAYDHELLKTAAKKIETAKRYASAQTWVSRFSSIKKLRTLAAEHLVREGILSEEEHRILLLFHQTRFPERDGTAEDSIVSRVRNAILGNDEVDLRTASLVGIAHAAGLLKPLFERRELKERKSRIESIMESTPTADAVHDAVKAVQASIIAATVAASTAATTAATT